MTIAEYLQETETNLSRFKNKDGKTLQQTLMETTHIWSNETCTSYCAFAMAMAGFSEDDTTRVLETLQTCFETIPIEHAEMLGLSLQYDDDDEL